MSQPRYRSWNSTPTSHDDVHRRALHAARCKTPLAHGLDGAVAQPAAQSAQHLHVADRAVAPHHNLELHFAFDVAAPRLVRVVGFHFAQQPRRFNAAAGTDTGRRRCRRPSRRRRRCRHPRPDPCPTGARATAGAGSLAWRRLGAFASTPSRFSISAGLVAIGAITGGSGFASSGGGGGSGGSGFGRIGGGNLRAGSGLLIFSTPCARPWAEASSSSGRRHHRRRRSGRDEEHHAGSARPCSAARCARRPRPARGWR